MGSSVASSVCPVDSVVRVFRKVLSTATSSAQRGASATLTPQLHRGGPLGFHFQCGGVVWSAAGQRRQRGRAARLVELGVSRPGADIGAHRGTGVKKAVLRQQGDGQGLDFADLAHAVDGAVTHDVVLEAQRQRHVQRHGVGQHVGHAARGLRIGPDVGLRTGKTGRGEITALHVGLDLRGTGAHQQRTGRLRLGTARQCQARQQQRGCRTLESWGHAHVSCVAAAHSQPAWASVREISCASSWCP